MGRGDRVVGDHDDALPELVHAATEQGEHVGGGAGVEVAGGLVGEDHCWASGQGPGAGHPLLLAAGQLTGTVSEAGAQVDGVDDLVQPGGGGGAGGGGGGGGGRGGGGGGGVWMIGPSGGGWGGRRARSGGRVMFSWAVTGGSRLNDGKMTPPWSRRSRVRARSGSAVISVSPMKACPVVGVS